MMKAAKVLEMPIDEREKGFYFDTSPRNTISYIASCSYVIIVYCSQF